MQTVSTKCIELAFETHSIKLQGDTGALHGYAKLYCSRNEQRMALNTQINMWNPIMPGALQPPSTNVLM